MSDVGISAEFPYKSHYADLSGTKMHYIEQGSGDPILFLHGIPTSSYLWRNVIPHLSKLGRCIAPDLMGMGKSDKPDIEYSIFDHINYLEQFIQTLKLNRIVLVVHGWGSIIGLAYAMKHPDKFKGLVFYEAYLRANNGDDESLPYREQLLMLKNPEEFGNIVQDAVSFVDKVMPPITLRKLSSEEMNFYREPFAEKNSGKPLLQYVKEVLTPNKNKIEKVIEEYSEKLTESQLPKLLLYSVPGFITTIATAMWAKENLPNLEIIDLGEELHFAQESQPTTMGESISIWLQGVEQG